MKKNQLITTLLLFSGFTIAGQNLKTLEPKIGKLLDFTPDLIEKFNSDESLKKCDEIWEKAERENDGTYTNLTAEQKEILKYCDESKETIWEIIGTSCSWYCGGGLKKVTASSYLKKQGENSYAPENANDLNYKTAWAEGVSGYGIGEFLTYYFVPESPRINKIIIVNGYIKSQSSWEENSRVKQLKMYINNKPYAILNLKDIRAEQEFTVDPIGSNDRINLKKLKNKPEWTIKFEILDIYKGKKYDDVIISEIYFDGLDVHCLAKGTKISLPDNGTKNIEDLKIGDTVLTYDFKTNKITESIIKELATAMHYNLVTYIFENNAKITATHDHPFLIKDKGWASLDPDKSALYQGFDKIKKIEINDYFKLSSKENRELANVKLVEIKYLKSTEKTYTISKLSSGTNFIANGLIVGVEQLK